MKQMRVYFYLIALTLVLSLGIVSAVENTSNSSEQNLPVGLVCSDSDGGLDYYVKGTTSGKRFASSTTIDIESDSCLSTDPGVLNEYSCGDGRNLETNVRGGIYYRCPNGCLDGACIQDTNTSSQPVTEHVVCAFKGASGFQKCYSSDGKYSCSVNNPRITTKDENRQPIVECVMKIGGESKDKISWKSSCGDGESNEGNEYTIIDGDDETVTFDCFGSHNPTIRAAGTYNVKKGYLIDLNGVTAEIRGITWALSGDTELKVEINGMNAQVCSLHKGETCKLFSGPVTAQYDYGIEITVKSITKDESSTDNSDALLVISEIGKASTMEKVKCVFTNSTTEQECFGRNDVTGASFGCSGIETCVVEIEGHAGDKFSWKSSCNSGIQNTLFDGNNEYAVFYCGNETKVETNLFTSASWSCHGEAPAGTRAPVGAGGECRSPDEWMHIAKDACQSSCTKEGKCGVNSFSLGDKCGRNVIINPRIDSKVPVEVKPEVGTTVSCNGCLVDDKCYPLGYRKDGNFCSDSNEFVAQVSSDMKCDNNFECDSNVCVSGQCISPGLIENILNWFKKLFGN